MVSVIGRTHGFVKRKKRAGATAEETVRRAKKVSGPFVAECARIGGGARFHVKQMDDFGAQLKRHRVGAVAEQGFGDDSIEAVAVTTHVVKLKVAASRLQSSQIALLAAARCGRHEHSLE